MAETMLSRVINSLPLALLQNVSRLQVGVMDCKDIWHVPARQPNKSLNRTRITASLSCLPEAARVLFHHHQRRERAIADQVPDAPLSLSVTGTTLRYVLATRIALAVEETAQRAPSGVSPEAQSGELAPASFTQHLDRPLAANHKGNA